MHISRRHALALTAAALAGLAAPRVHAAAGGGNMIQFLRRRQLKEKQERKEQQERKEDQEEKEKDETKENESE